MNMTTLIDTLRDAIAGDNTLEAWCNANYSYPTLYVGIDLDKPPGESDYPVVHLYPVNKHTGYEAEEIEHIVGCSVGIYDATLSTSTQGNTSIKEYRGISRCETFRKYVEALISGNIPSGKQIDDLQIEYSPPECFPFFLADMRFTISQVLSQGDDVFD